MAPFSLRKQLGLRKKSQKDETPSLKSPPLTNPSLSSTPLNSPPLSTPPLNSPPLSIPPEEARQTVSHEGHIAFSSSEDDVRPGRHGVNRPPLEVHTEVHNSTSARSGFLRFGLPSTPTYKSEASVSTTATRTRSRSPNPAQNPLGLHVVHTPPAPEVGPRVKVKANIVFVHGLGGTSRMTWSKNKDIERLFWPRLFLPQEQDIGTSARILTFGYNAGVKGRGGASVKSILDFAKDLLYDLKYSKDEDGNELELDSVPLIFVAHSMGGLIVKEAYMQGQFDPEYEAVTKAVAAILFMSTPHRGSNLAETLNRILQVSFVSTPRQYIDDLVKNSSTVQRINEQFRHLAPWLTIVSFYETQPTPMGPAGKVMVVEKDSSVLGYPGEVSKPLDADHHTVCKFDSEHDPNYVTVRNYIKTHMAKLFSQQTSKSSLYGGTPLEIRDLESFFGITEPPDTDYIFFRDRWAPTTCDWILRDSDFSTWLDPESTKPDLLWLHGSGGSGKSVLASYIVNHLVESGLCCQYVFIRFGDQAKRSLSRLLRSLAFQMARALPHFRSALGTVARTVKLKGLDPRTIWQRVFKAVMLRIELAEPIYWVLDGLDECDDSRQAIKFFGEILPGSSPIRIIVLSRPSPDIEMELKRLPAVPARWHSLALKQHEQTEDFRAFIDQELECNIPKFRTSIIEKLMETAQGSFLWLKLTVDRINRCHTEEDVERALHELPPGMEELFDRMAQAISALGDSDRSLTTSILSWATCSFRLLTVSDMSQALKAEAPRLINLQRSITDLCGGFLVIDNEEKVTMVHQAAREYLLGGKGRPFNIAKKEAHEKLLLRCLATLSTPGLRTKISNDQKPALLFYAASYWASHLGTSSSVSEQTVAAVVRFLRGSCVLTWIQAVAQSGKLHVLVRTSNRLSSFAARLNRANADKMPLKQRTIEHELIKGWATDLSKIVGKFGSQLLRDPESIYKAIPPFCPPDSFIYKQFGHKNSPTLSVGGFSTTAWDDGVAALSIPSGHQINDILSEGPWVVLSATMRNMTTVFVYDASTFQQVRRIRHQQRVRMIQVNRLGTLLVTCGFSTTKVWDLSNGARLASATNPPGRPRPHAITFTKDDTCILISSEDRKQWQLSISGEGSTFEQTGQIMDRTEGGGLVNAPSCSALSPDGRLLALGYRKTALSLWEVDDPDSEALVRCHELERLQEMIWHPFASEILGMHTGGVVFKWDYEIDDLIKAPVGASSIAINPKGHLLVTGDMYGTVSVLSTSDLSVVYRIVSQDAVMGVAFSADGYQLYDIRRTYGNVWAPDALLKLSEPIASNSDAGSMAESAVESYASNLERSYDRIDRVTALAPQPNGRLYCTGSEAGVITVHIVASTAKGSGKLELGHTHNYSGIEQIEWSQDGTLLCAADLSRTIRVYRVTHDLLQSGSSALAAELVLEMSVSLAATISQIIFQRGGDRLLVANCSTAVVISLSTKEVVMSQSMEDEHNHAADDTAGQGPAHHGGRWIMHPSSDDYLLMVSPTEIAIHEWTSLEKVVSIPLSRPPNHLVPVVDPLAYSNPDVATPVLTSKPNSWDVAAPPQADMSSAMIEALVGSPSRRYLLMDLSIQTEDRSRTGSVLLDLASGLSEHILPTGGSHEAPQALAAESSSPVTGTETSSAISLVELPSELVGRLKQPLNIIQSTRGVTAGAEILLFLDHHLSLCSWVIPGSKDASSAIPQNGQKATVSPPLQSTASFQPQRGGVRPPLGSPGLSISSAASFRGGRALPQSITEHYSLPGDWASPHCVALVQTLNDGTLLCPRNGQVGVVRCMGFGL